MGDVVVIREGGQVESARVKSRKRLMRFLAKSRLLYPDETLKQATTSHLALSALLRSKFDVRMSSSGDD